MIRIVCLNQRGGAAKTTTATTLARIFAERNLKTLLIDCDSQGSVSAILGLKPKLHLSDLLMQRLALDECIVKAHDKLDVLCSDRKTTEAEQAIAGQIARETVFEQFFAEPEKAYEAVLIDVAPSITLFQTCAILYTRQVLIPVAMETMSVQGCLASIQAADALNRFFRRDPPIKCVGILPVMVDRRLQMTSTVLDALADISAKTGVSVLPQIRTDTTVPKAARERTFVVDLDPRCKAVEDYNSCADALLQQLGSVNGRRQAQAQ